MSTIDDDIDRLYQGPLEAFTDQRNALAKAAKRPDVKTLAKPSVPAWAVNQLYWHERKVIDRLVAASEALLVEHRRRLAGEAAEIGDAEQAHREALRDAVAAARERLTAGGQATAPATLEAVRRTLQALPSPEASGRLVRPLAPQGLEALAGLVMKARPGPIPAPKPPPGRTVTPLAVAPRAATADDAAARKRQARAAEKAARERAVRRGAAEKALAAARDALAHADEAVEVAERDLAARQADRVAARDALKRAQRLVEELSFGR